MAKILLVDDDKDLVDANKTLLTATGYEVFTAFNGIDGFNKAKEIKPDLILLDVMMATDSEGFDISRKIAAEDTLKETKVLLLTGVQKAKNLPFEFKPDETWLPVLKILEKPIKPQELLKEVQQMIG